MRTINYITLHCTGGPQNQTPKEILHYWKVVNGWDLPGYHHMIDAAGVIHDLLPIETPSNGVKGFNAHAIHICYIGGVQTKSHDPINALGKAIDNRTDAQRKSMIMLVNKYSEMYPTAVIQGHRDFSVDKNRDGIIEPSEWMKTCPSFSAKDWLHEIGFKSYLPLIILTTNKVVNIREGHGVEFKTVTNALDKGVKVRKLAEAAGWTYVKVTNTDIKGWIRSDFLS